MRQSLKAGLIAVLLVVLWQAAAVRYLWNGNWTGLFCVGSQVPMPEEAAAGVFRVPDSRGYDAQFYRLIAHDPFFTRGYQRFIDDARLRYRRILLPGAAYLLAMGQPGIIDAAYIVCMLVSVFLGVLWTGRWFEQNGRSGLHGLLFLLVPAVLTSVERMLLDGPLCALFAGFAWKLSKGERPWGILLCAPLVKETGLFFAAAVCIADWRSGNWKRTLPVIATQLPALLWFVFVQVNTPPSRAEVILARPVIGQLERLITPRDHTQPPAVKIALQVVDVVAIVSLLSCCFLALAYYRPYSTAVELAAVLFALLGLELGSSVHLVEAYGFARPVSPLLWWLLASGVLSRKWLIVAAPLGMTIGVSLPMISETVRILRSLV